MKRFDKFVDTFVKRFYILLFAVLICVGYVSFLNAWFGISMLSIESPNDILNLATFSGVQSLWLTRWLTMTLNTPWQPLRLAMGFLSTLRVEQWILILGGGIIMFSKTMNQEHKRIHQAAKVLIMLLCVQLVAVIYSIANALWSSTGLEAALSLQVGGWVLLIGGTVGLLFSLMLLVASLIFGYIPLFIDNN
ncbi:MAG: hypothetical protein Q8S15_00160 [Erysipelotrichaceae bacterium]|nr:hypothetical protein [Erysipelotrichaceae bacterium]